jgi:hypothetical protein
MKQNISTKNIQPDLNGPTAIFNISFYLTAHLAVFFFAPI